MCKCRYIYLLEDFFYLANGAEEITNKFTFTVYALATDFPDGLAFDGYLNTFTHAKASPNWLILKSDKVFSIDVILISAHRPYSDQYIVSIGTNDNNLAENQVCF